MDDTLTLESGQTHTEQAGTQPTRIQHVGAEQSIAPGPELLEELLIEEISIDGMCGVY